MFGGLGYLNKLGASGGLVFSPGQLFSGGEQGAWYDPSDNTTMFQDSAGTTAVTAVEQAVGLICDKRNGANFSVRYNLFTFSEQFDNAAWTKQQTTVTANSTTAPDGTLTADKVIPDVVLTAHAVRTDVTTTVQSYAFSVYAKAAEYIWITVYNTTGGWGRTFNLQTGTVGTATIGAATATIQDAGNGWYRCIVVGTATATSNAFRVYVNNGDTIAPTFSGDGTSGLFLWGAQLQTGSSATTYQPTATYPTSWPSGNHAFQTTSASRPTLRARYNLLTYSEEFDNAVWTASKSAGASVAANTTIAPDGTLTADTVTFAASSDFIIQTLSSYPAVTGQQVIFSIYSRTATQIIIFGGATPAGTNTFVVVDVGNGWFRQTLTRTFTTTVSGNLQLIPAGSIVGAGSFVIWGAQVTQPLVFPSNVYQRIAAATDYATGAAFPQYLSFDGTDDSLLTANVDFATVTSDGQARRNLLLNPTQFDAAGWTRQTLTVTANATTAPDGSLTADKLIPSATPATQQISQLSVVSSQTCTMSIYAKADGINTFEILDGTGGSNGGAFDLLNVTASNKGTGQASIVAVGDGWYRCIAVATTTGFRLYCPNSTGSASGSGTSGVFIWGAQLETGSTATAFQNIGTDQMTVWSGLSKLSDAAVGILAELTISAATTAGGMQLVVPVTPATSLNQYFTRGSVAPATATSNVAAAPITLLYTGQSNIGADSMLLRRNGAQVSSSSDDQGTGNFSNAPLFIGRRNNASLPFNGRIYSLIVRGAASNSSQVAQTERYVASKTPLGVVP